MDNLKRKPFEVPTLTAHGKLSELTQNGLKINHGHGHAWAWGHDKYDELDDPVRVSAAS